MELITLDSFGKSLKQTLDFPIYYDAEEEEFDVRFNPFHRPDLWKQLREGKIKDSDEYFEKLVENTIKKQRII